MICLFVVVYFELRYRLIIADNMHCNWKTQFYPSSVPDRPSFSSTLLQWRNTREEKGISSFSLQYPLSIDSNPLCQSHIVTDDLCCSTLFLALQ